MSRRKKRSEQVELVKTLMSLSPQKQTSVLRFLDANAVDLICECVHNVIFTNLGEYVIIFIISQTIQ